MYGLTIGMLGTTPVPLLLLLFAVEFVTLVFVKPSDGELILVVDTTELLGSEDDELDTLLLFALLLLATVLDETLEWKLLSMA